LLALDCMDKPQTSKGVVAIRPGHWRRWLSFLTAPGKVAVLLLNLIILGVAIDANNPGNAMALGALGQARRQRRILLVGRAGALR
jgi:hypothetical protein